MFVRFSSLRLSLTFSSIARSFPKMYNSDTECSRRTNTSMRQLSRRALGSEQDLSRRAPTLNEIISNQETFALLAEFLEMHGRESLIGFCAVVLAINNLQSDRRQAIYAVKAAYREYILHSNLSSQWLQSTTREAIREALHQRDFDPFRIFQPAMKDLLQYLKQNFYANFLSSKIWKNYLNKKNVKRLKTLNSSTPKKISHLSVSSLSSTRSERPAPINRTIAAAPPASTFKTPLACFIQNKDVPYMIYLNLPVEKVTLEQIQSRIHHLAGKKFDPTRSECHYYFKRRIDPSEIALINDGLSSSSSAANYVYEEIDADDLHTPVPHLDGTIVCKFDFHSE